MENNLPELTLTPFADAAPSAPAVPDMQNLQQTAQIEEPVLSAEEQQLVDQFADQIDLSNTTVVLQYGAAAQKKISDFSDTALESVRTKDLGEVGGMLADLVTQLRGFDEEETAKGFFGKFKKNTNKISTLQAKYAAAETNVDRIVNALEAHQLQLLKDIAVLDRLYDMNLQYFKELSLYILAGKKRLQRAREAELSALLEKAKRTSLPEDSQAANDFAQKCDRFEKKLHDLELTRMVAIQMAPQIRLVQNNDSVMCEKIQSTVANTIPLWKSQMVIALGLVNAQNALEAQRSVTDMTNELLRKNAEALRIGTIETAKEAERGVVEIETLQQTNTMLIETLDEVARIQADGRAKRRAAEAALVQLENEVKAKLQAYSNPNT